MGVCPPFSALLPLLKISQFCAVMESSFQWQIPYALLVLLAMIILLAWDRYKSSLVFLLAVAAFLLAGIIEVPAFTEGLSNRSVLTIFLLIVLTGGINDYFNLSALFDFIFRNTRTAQGFIMRMGVGVAGVSAFMNNTPVVAMMMPYVYQWGKKNEVNPSQLLMPLSFAAIMGGVITLIGTSTNLVLNGLMEENGVPTFALFDFAIPGLLVTVVCLAALTLIAPRLLAGKGEHVLEEDLLKREYLVETRILSGAPMIGKTVEEAGLRNLEGGYLVEIIREKRHLAPVSPGELLYAGDVLLFAGDTHTILELIKQHRGLEFSKDRKFQLPENAQIIEAVVAQNSALERQTAKQASFREKFDAAIIGIHRHGERLSGKLGAIPLHTGDLLMMTVGPDFSSRNAKTRDLVVINKIKKPQVLSPMRKRLFIASLLLVILAMSLSWLSLFEGLLALFMSQLLLQMITVDKVRRSVSFDLLVVLISALALGKGLIECGAAAWLTDHLFAGAAAWPPLCVLLAIFGVTFLLTSLVTNVAAIAIIFPVIYSLSLSSAIPTPALFLTAAYGASCCFATPFAYQTNLMIMELGNYRFKDFLRVGLPLSMLYAAVSIGYIYFTIQ